MSESFETRCEHAAQVCNAHERVIRLIETYGFRLAPMFAP